MDHGPHEGDMKRFLIALAAFSLMAFAGCGGPPDRDDIRTSALPLKDQQRAIWLFERQLQCVYFSPCLDAMAGGALGKDPAGAVEACSKAHAGLLSLSVPAGLPVKVDKTLNEARLILERNADWSLKSARFAAGDSVSPAGPIPGNAQTSDAYSRIDHVNALYGLKGFMKGSYVRCDVMYGRLPDFPKWKDLK
jgi:hypothetical protein